MQRLRLFRWLAPGIRIKRWFFLFAIGVCFLVFGVMLLLNYSWVSAVEDIVLKLLYEATGAYDYTVLAMIGMCIIAVGIVAMYFGARKMVNTIVRAILPRTGEDDTVSDYIFQNLRLGQGPKIVVIGGGTGLSTLLRGLKNKSSNLTAIVTVADDGGSSGRLREDLQMVAPGDLRNCLVALAEKEGLMERLFRYRFEEAGDLSGHSFGNLFLAALTQVLDDDIEGALDAASKILKVRGRVIPSTTEAVVLSAVLEDGTIVRGESQIPTAGKPIRQVFLEPEEPVTEGAALQAIDEADMIIIGPGSLYTSIMPNLLIGKIKEHIKHAKATKMYICNVMTQPGETDGYTVTDHVRVIENHAGEGLIDIVLANSSVLNEETMQACLNKGYEPVRMDVKHTIDDRIRVIGAKLVNEENMTTHDSERLGKVVMDVFYAIKTDLEVHILNYYLNRNDH